MASNASTSNLTTEPEQIAGPSNQYTSNAPATNPTTEPEPTLGSPDPWEQRNLLSLDGGGIRGIWSLLVLEKLMEYIAREEGNHEEPARHSFYPELFPDYVSHGRFLRKEEEHNPETWMACRRYLPCHYFDIICGSSTGALIAIMLGRLRMPVSDCRHEYESLADRIFGNPRHLTLMSTGFIKRAKYDYKILEETLRDVAERREKVLTDDAGGEPLFQSSKGLCATFVTSLRRAPKNAGGSGRPALLRSYDNTKRGKTPKDQAGPNRLSHHPTGLTRADVMDPNLQELQQQRRNTMKFSGESLKWPVWKVARAATAADFYFDPVVAKVQGGREEVTFTDGGLDERNNPTMEGVSEIRDLYGLTSLGTVVSIGTARGEAVSSLTLKAKLKSMIAEKTDPGKVHREAKDNFARSEKQYFRLNDPGALKIELDEWKPRNRRLWRSAKKCGSETLEVIGKTFDKWANNPARTEAFQICAKELVKRRRARTKNSAKWEHFAKDAQFLCYWPTCEETFLNREDFKRHVQEMHGETLRGEEGEQKIKECTREWEYQQPQSSQSD